jgi:hypothetical protein
MTSPIVVSSAGGERIAYSGTARFKLKNVEAKDGKDGEGNVVRRIRFSFVRKTPEGDVYATKSPPARLPRDADGKATALFEFMKRLAPKEFRGDMRFDPEATWKLALSKVNEFFELEIKHEDGWNNIVDVLEAYGKDAPVEDDGEMIL